jgi:hypothetical protein
MRESPDQGIQNLHKEFYLGDNKKIAVQVRSGRGWGTSEKKTGRAGA